MDFLKFNSIYTSEANQDVKIDISHQQIQKINVFACNFDLIVVCRQNIGNQCLGDVFDVLEMFLISLPALERFRFLLVKMVDTVRNSNFKRGELRSIPPCLNFERKSIPP